MGVCCAKDDDEGFDYVATQVVDLPLKADASPDESPEWNPKELQVILNNVLRRRSLFCDESPCLSDNGREVAQELAQVLEEYAHVGIIVRGYPSRSSINDNSPYESHQLGLERARAVRDFLAATCDCNIFAVEGEDHVDGRTAEVELEVCEAEEATVQQSESGVQQSDSGDDISSETADADEHCRSHTPQVRLRQKSCVESCCFTPVANRGETWTELAFLREASRGSRWWASSPSPSPA